MTPRLRSRAAAAAGLVLVALSLQVQPASAHATVAVTSPGANQLLDSPDATVGGQVTLGSHTLGGTTVDKVTMKLALAGQPDVTASTAPAAGGGFAFPVSLPRNGSYVVTLSASWKHTGLDSATGSATDSRTFLVAVPPATPTNVKTAVDAAARTVAVSWKANTEPDLIRYEVKRAKGNSSDFTVVAKPKAGETSFVDTTTSSAGGDYRYVVVAVRNGVPGDEEIRSDPSTMTADAVAKVPDPPPPPTTAPPAGSAAAGTGVGTGTASSLPSGSPGAISTPGTVDLSGFNTVRNQTRSTPRTAVLPDPGFQSTLPFAPGGTIADEPLIDESGDLGEDLAADDQFRELGDEDSANDRARTMAFFAAGLLSTVLLMHVLWVKSEVRRVPLEALEPEAPVAGEDWYDPAAGKGRRTRKKGVAPTVDDIAADTDFAPVVVAPKMRGGKNPLRPTARSGSRRQKVSSGV